MFLTSGSASVGPHGISYRRKFWSDLPVGLKEGEGL